MSRRPHGRFTKETHTPEEADVRPPGQGRVAKFKAGKNQDPSARPPRRRRK